MIDKRTRRWSATLGAALFTSASPLSPMVVSAHAQALPEEAQAAAAYCTNLAEAAEDARFTLKLNRIRAAEEKVDERLAALEAKRAEYQEWLEKRQTFLDLARDNLVAIYSGMRPDAASEQLAAMNELTAAAVIARIEPRTASAILNEMETDKAARIATIMAGLARDQDNHG